MFRNKKINFVPGFLVIFLILAGCTAEKNRVKTPNTNNVLKTAQNSGCQIHSQNKLKIMQVVYRSDNDLSEDSTKKKNNLVIINGQPLTKDQISEIKEMYGITPVPGNYWYDAASGLYGVVGFQAFGFMFAGHNFGKLSIDASAGNTGVVINGRELPQLEWAVWSQIIGYWIQPGYYWLDQYGNAGYEGNPLPVINLYVAAQQNSYGGGGGGDNFWSSRFSAGNYDSGNQRGYVSVPGYGPVGYGF